MKIIIAVPVLAALVGGAGFAQSPEWHDPNSVAAAAVASSPAIRALAAETDAAREAARSAGALPNPMAMGGVQNLNDDLSNDMMMTMYMLGASQSFVPGAQRRSLERAAQATIGGLESTQQALSAEIARDARATWIELASIDERRAIIETVLSLTDAIVASSRARYETGSAIQADILRAQLVKSDLQHTLLTLDGDRKVAAATLRSLLGLGADAEIPRLHLAHGAPEAPPVPAIGAEHPAIAALQAEVDRRIAEIDLAESATRPEWSVEASYNYRTETNGMITVLGRVELPVRRKATIEPRIREAIARRDAAQQRIEELRRSLTEQAAIAASVLQQATAQLAFHDEVLVPQAKMAFDSTLAAYQTARADFDALLGSESAYVRLATDYYQYLERALEARADLVALAQGARSIRVGAAGVRADAAPSSPGAASSRSMGSM
ncbi:MAG TPA: TolC family protein [Thermoanaerobaculia bacterium]|nr:TolC family protein [Thermoanaerobaculia bacterium]